MIAHLAFAALFLVAVGALAIQHAYWRGRFEMAQVLALPIELSERRAR